MLKFTIGRMPVPGNSALAQQPCRRLLPVGDHRRKKEMTPASIMPKKYMQNRMGADEDQWRNHREKNQRRGRTRSVIAPGSPESPFLTCCGFIRQDRENARSALRLFAIRQMRPVRLRQTAAQARHPADPFGGGRVCTNR